MRFRLPFLPHWRLFRIGSLKRVFTLPPVNPSDSTRQRIWDIVVWNTSHPACRDEVHDLRLRSRKESLTRWRLHRHLSLLKGVAPERPGWLRDSDTDA